MPKTSRSGVKTGDAENPRARTVGASPSPGRKGHPSVGNPMRGTPQAAAAEGERQAKQPRGM